MSNVTAPRKPAARAAAGSELAAPLAQAGEAQQRFAKLLVGGEFEAVDARMGQRRAQFGFALLCIRAKSLAKALVLRVDKELLAGFCILQDDETEIGQRQFHGIEEAHRDDFMPSGEQAERLAPARGADEIRHDEDR